MSAPVTVAIVCRDRGRLLEDAVDGAYAQGPAVTEILIVDDGSHDPVTRRLLAGYRWPRVRVVRQPRAHAAAARNRALGEAANELVCLLDAADRLEPGFLARALAALASAPDTGSASAWFRTCGALEVEVRAAEAGPAAVIGGVLPEAALWRRAAVAVVGGFDESLPEGDETADLRLRMAAAGSPVALVPEALVVRHCGFTAGSRPAAAGQSAAFATRHAEAIAAHAVAISRHRAELVTALWNARPSAPEAPRNEVSLELDEARRHILGLEHALSHAHQRLAALGDSWSWRITAPLRALHARLTGGRSPRSSG